jgi:hypothetical protein
MTNRTGDGTLIGYTRSIGAAIGSDDDALLDLVEDFMRAETGGTLDALSGPNFDRLARGCMADVLAWNVAGAVNGVTLTGYCATGGLPYPEALDTVGAVFAIEL